MGFETNYEKLERRLNEEKEHLWKAFQSLEQQFKGLDSAVKEVEKSAPDHFKELKSSSRDASYYRNRAEEQFKEAAELVKQITSNSADAMDFHNAARSHHENIHNAYTNATNTLELIDQAYSNYEEEHIVAVEQIDKLQGLANRKNLLEEQLSNISSLNEDSQIYFDKIKSLHASSERDRKYIQGIYNDIYGHEFEDEDGETQFLEGLSKQLERSYEKLKGELSGLNSELDDLKNNQNEKLMEYETDAKSRVEDFIETSEKQRTALVDQINSLLPSALTAGLSGAYADKIVVEKNEAAKFETSFKRSIYALVCASLIPVCTNIIRIYNGEELKAIMSDMPLFMLMMIPMYIPILWVAYSSNKSYKLSKRLIEEYTHKEVLSKTFEGLSKQIESIGEESPSEGLRAKLIYNLLQVNSENPGKLISDYNNSDHPILDAIDKSTKFTDALGKLENVPLLSPLLKHLSAREHARLAKASDDASRTIETEVTEKREDKKEQAA
ncbi:hypothetical protein TUMSATVNIG1_16350 [Vibrio nigripulchritudo]|uniref:hypothetical protein n=1 Tax=Vibrio nigripulchritudo TaxID=28173 RepID=UPI001909196A|nr:hypothetical protein [Vibrio nigripulchritudo]BCL69679.1 hypothetical protein VNTUMSATTG_16160 [Vibrio nigripulchritudo]BDU31026.1 hypothetical protein TUMSATVNIG1_16350 [Vibrio nigripulchritudo]